MNFTSRMTALLTEMRRERNGAVADAMRYFGTRYGLNYGVSLPTLRMLARAEQPDHDFARYLFLQDVRELRLAALHIAQPERLTTDETAFWAAGIVNSELAEEAAFALLSRTDALPGFFEAWIDGDDPLLQYAVLLAGARSEHLAPAWIEPAVDAVRRNAAAVAAGTLPAPAAMLTAQGAVALLAALGTRNAENRQAVLRMAGSLGKLPAEDFIHEELAWRLEA